MKDIGIILALGFIIVSGLGIGAWLVVQGHPWFGLFAMLIGGCISYSSKPDDKPSQPPPKVV
jgi:hypothetical protein